MIPRSSFSPREGKILAAVLWGSIGVFLTLMVVTWVLCERARPVLLELETGKPVAHRPAL